MKRGVLQGHEPTQHEQKRGSNRRSEGRPVFVHAAWALGTGDWFCDWIVGFAIKYEDLGRYGVKMDDLSAQDFGQPVMLRPHHGMCLAYFKGYGYSDEFAAHMQEVKEHLMEDAIVYLTVETDIICSKCPNNINGDCEKPELVARYDSEVLRHCGLSEGTQIRFGEFAELVQGNILAKGLRGEICRDCQWDGICR